jgi:hypothetical protein
MSENIAPQHGTELTWADVFPWLQDYGYPITGFGLPIDWQRHPMSDAKDPQQVAILSRLATIALERLSNWTIGDIFPTLPSGLQLNKLPFSTRARNVLARQHFSVFADLQDLDVQDLLGIQLLGAGTLRSMLQILAEEAVTSPSMPLRSHSPVGPVAGKHFKVPAPVHDLPNESLKNLLRIARWLAIMGAPDATLLGTHTFAAMPQAIQEARRHLTDLTARDVLGTQEAGIDAAAIITETISSLDEREQLLALDQLGTRLAVTRERVRQIESRLRADLVQLITASGALDLLSQSTRQLIGTLLPLEDLLAMLPALRGTVGGLDQSVWRVLDLLDDSYEVRDGWCAAPSLSAAQALTRAHLQELADAFGVVLLDDLGPLNAGLVPERDRKATLDWLRYCGQVLHHDDYVLTRTQSLGDRAAAILSIAGAPLSSEEVLDRLGVERSVTSLKNAMSADERIERVDRDRWALVDWKLDAYAGVRALISEELLKSGGQVPMDLLT